MAVEIDNLQVKITASAQNATSALNSLVTALQKVRTALTGVGKDGLTKTDHISKSLNQMNGALNTLSTGGVKKLQKLANALKDYADSLKAVKSAGSGVANDIRKIESALSAGSKKYHDTSGDVNVDADVPINSDTTGSGDTADIKTKISLIDRLRESIKKLRAAMKTAGDETKKTEGFIKKLFNSLKRIALYRAIRSAMKAIAQAFEEGLKNAYGYSKQSETFTRLADSLDHLKSVTAQMVNQLGALWGEIRQLVQPAIEWIVEKVRMISEWLTELFAALNGAKTYLQAQYVAQAWDDATDAAKKYKQQLLGIDEINNLSTQQNGSGKEETDYSKLYKEVEVSQGMLKIGEVWSTVTNKIKGALTEIETMLGGFMIGIGAALLFSGANIPLGLGLIVAGGFMAGKAIAEKWDELGTTLEKKIALIEGLLGGFLLGVGAVIAFTGANFGLGIGLMIAGASILGVSAITLNWDKMDADLKKVITAITVTVSAALLALGAILTFSGVKPTLGIPLMAAGAVGLATAVFLNWATLYGKLRDIFGSYKLLFGMAAGMAAIGAILLFTGVATPLGIGLLIASGVLTATNIALNWDSILDGLKEAWANIKAWWNSSVMPGVERGINKIETSLNIDINKDGKIGFGNSSYEILGGAFTVKEGSLTDDIITNVKELFRGGNSHGAGAHFATGGIPTQGSLFYAGESGAEFVGSIGSTSAVANTEQMTDAIYKAAYMGMSQALRENGGNGMSGYTPATGDDLFLIMRKKANAYNKMTGNPAFN